MSALATFSTDDGATLSYPLASGLKTTRLGLGCMHFGGSWNPGTEISEESWMAGKAAFETALDLGWNFFDHADIYGKGRSEVLFGKLMKEMGVDRESIIIQSKCGICLPDDPQPGLPRWYDSSKGHILAAVEGSLRRLQTDYLDTLLLHRPDYLMEVDEVLEAFESLRSSGKVRHFGVSNFTPDLLELIHAAGFTPVANQVQINLLKTRLLDSCMVSQRGQETPGHPTDGTLEWHRRHGVVTQAWSPMAYGYLSGRDADRDDERIPVAAAKVLEIADAHDVSTEAIVLAWLLRHPAMIQPVIGTRHPERLRACNEALEIELSRTEWYAMYHAGSGTDVP